MSPDATNSKSKTKSGSISAKNLFCCSKEVAFLWVLVLQSRESLSFKLVVEVSSKALVALSFLSLSPNCLNGRLF